MTRDVLYAVAFSNRIWVECHGKQPVEFLKSNGIDAGLWDVAGKSGDDLTAELEQLKPRLVINCAYFIHHGRFQNLATRFPHVRFVAHCHSSQADLARNACWLRSQFEYAKIADTLANCYYAVVDERMELMERIGCNRLIHLGPCMLPRVHEPNSELHSPPTVSLICEWRVLKNITNQILAVSLASQRTPCTLLLCIGNDRRRMAATFASGVGVEYEERRWMPHDEYLGMIAKDVDIGLQASYTESYNFVAMEHMLAGKPVIGSPAIRFLPDQWQPNPDDPRAIASCLSSVLEDYQSSSLIATTESVRSVSQSNRDYLRVIRSLIE